MSTSWKTQRERGSTNALRIILWVALNLGRKSARLLLFPITLYFLLTGRVQRRSSKRFLTRALGRPARLVDVAKHIHTFSATILDRVFLLANRLSCVDVRLHNPDVVLEHVRNSQGCILLGSHLGSFEILRALAKLEYQIPLKVLMYPQHNERITQILAQLNPQILETVIPLGQADTLIRVEESLSQGYLVGMLGDRITDSSRITSCRFFDKKTAFPEGPMLLASILKVPVILFFGLYRGENRYDIFFEKFADHVSVNRGQRTTELQKWTQCYADRLEYFAREAPYNWFNFFDYWNEDEGQP